VKGDFRVPDWGLHRRFVRAAFLDTAAMVVEILSPDDETYEKFPFYAAHGVDEMLVVEPEGRRVRVFALAGEGYEETDRSGLLGVDGATLEAAIRWR
jgi:hypothetical protein